MENDRAETLPTDVAKFVAEVMDTPRGRQAAAALDQKVTADRVALASELQRLRVKGSEEAAAEKADAEAVAAVARAAQYLEDQKAHRMGTWSVALRLQQARDFKLGQVERELVASADPRIAALAKQLRDLKGSQLSLPDGPRMAEGGLFDLRPQHMPLVWDTTATKAREARLSVLSGLQAEVEALKFEAIEGEALDRRLQDIAERAGLMAPTGDPRPWYGRLLGVIGRRG
jgi:hypothetical protein